jgi:hypothetical protein
MYVRKGFGSLLPGIKIRPYTEPSSYVLCQALIGYPPLELSVIHRPTQTNPSRFDNTHLPT